MQTYLMWMRTRYLNKIFLTSSIMVFSCASCCRSFLIRISRIKISRPRSSCLSQLSRKGSIILNLLTILLSTSQVLQVSRVMPSRSQSRTRMSSMISLHKSRRSWHQIMCLKVCIMNSQKELMILRISL